MTTEITRRRELHDFLHAARSRLEPEDIGIRVGPNRRRSGLHQADVATALAVSGRWYNAFENSTGHGPPDPGLLDRLAGILQLTPAERVRLYLLAAGHEPAPATTDTHSQAPEERAALERLVGLAGPDLPALLCDVAWNILAWNQALSLQQIPAARRLWLRQHIPGPIPITPRRIQPPGSETPTGSDLVSAEFPGRLRLLILVPAATGPLAPHARKTTCHQKPPARAPRTRRLGKCPPSCETRHAPPRAAPLYTEPGAQRVRNQAPPACPDSAFCPGM